MSEGLEIGLPRRARRKGPGRAIPTGRERRWGRSKSAANAVRRVLLSVFASPFPRSTTLGYAESKRAASPQLPTQLGNPKRKLYPCGKESLAIRRRPGIDRNCLKSLHWRLHATPKRSVARCSASQRSISAAACSPVCTGTSLGLSCPRMSSRICWGDPGSATFGPWGSSQCGNGSRSTFEKLCDLHRIHLSWSLLSKLSAN